MNTNKQENNIQNAKNLSKNQYKNMGEFKFTSKDTSEFNIEKLMPVNEKNLSTDFNFSFAAQANPVIPPVINKDTQKQVLKEENKLPAIAKKNLNPVVPETDSEAEQIVNAVFSAKKYIVEEISEIFEKKLEKLDDAIMELISCKAENERLKAKIDNLTKDNYKLKKEIKSFKPIVPGLFIKAKNEEINL
ncbi:MAG TPA: hypothetical protein P5556_07875 [Candidatus Gastranaerophilales bacterium]|nr:hypothetical protein [Candidatus Gastranaerophilales bacterium]